MEAIGSLHEHLQRKQLLYDKFGAQVEALLAQQPDLLKKDEHGDDAAKAAQSQLNQMQLEALLKKKGILEPSKATVEPKVAELNSIGFETTSVSTPPTNVTTMLVAAPTFPVAAPPPPPTKTTVVATMGPQAQLELLMARKGVQVQGEEELSPLMTQQFTQVELVLSKLKGTCVRLEMENQVLNSKLQASYVESQRKDERIRALERELAALRPGQG
eukprot:GGOE01018251.1.p1 GENE.GGOE01018251.1~~GGOE01018251.1.p1  ORF type:complete len:216 (-),score=52.06 GGOE01018251.1:188-835(-)